MYNGVSSSIIIGQQRKLTNMILIQFDNEDKYNSLLQLHILLTYIDWLKSLSVMIVLCWTT